MGNRLIGLERKPTVCLQGLGPSANDGKIIGSRRKSRGRAPAFWAGIARRYPPKEEEIFGREPKFSARFRCIARPLEGGIPLSAA
jgi:hypothetical protein